MHYHENTEKVAVAMAKALDAEIMEPTRVDLAKLQEKNHRLLKDKLTSKGYMVIGEFTSPGFIVK